METTVCRVHISSPLDLIARHPRSSDTQYCYWVYIKMEALCSSERLPTIYQTTRPHNPEGSNMNRHHRQHLQPKLCRMLIFRTLYIVSSCKTHRVTAL